MICNQPMCCKLNFSIFIFLRLSPRECKFLSIIADEGLHPTSSSDWYRRGGGGGGGGQAAGQQCSGYHEIAR